MSNKDEIERAIAELETNLDRLSALYNQYFIGIEKTEPTVQRTNVDRKIRALRKLQINNTALRFRLQTQVQKYNTQSTYWRRVCKQIEEGTYQRHVMRAQRRQEKREQLQAGLIEEPARTSNPPPVYELDMDEPFADGPSADRLDFGSAMEALDDPFGDEPTAAKKRSATTPRTAPSPKAAAAKAAPAPPPPTGSAKATPGRSSRRPPPPPKAARKPATSDQIEKERMQKLYRTYMAAKKKCNEPTDNVSMEKLERTLNKQYKTRGGNVDFQVAIRGGKTVIKTVKKK